MKQFKYKAKRGGVEQVEGILLAETQDEVIAKINDMGLVPVQITEESNAGGQKGGLPWRGGAQSRRVTIFYRQLARLIESGIPLLPSLVIIKDQVTEDSFQRVIEDIKKNIQEGQPLSATLAHHTDYFFVFDLAVLEAGESAGKLHESLARIAQYRETQEALFSKIRSALIYPVFITCLGLAAVIFMMTFVVPKFSMLFSDLGQELPLLTRALIRSSEWIRLYGIWALLAGTFLFWAVQQSLTSGEPRKAWHRFLAGIPVLGKLVIMSELARLCRTLGLLIRSGIPLLRAVKLSLPVMTNEVLKDGILQSYFAIQEGGSFGESLRRSAFIPLFMTHLVRIGEESGGLEKAFTDIADWYEEELGRAMEVLTRLLEPLLIFVIGIALGLMIIAILLPVFSLSAMIP